MLRRRFLLASQEGRTHWYAAIEGLQEMHLQVFEPFSASQMSLGRVHRAPLLCINI